MKTTVPSWVNLTALSARFSKTARSRNASPETSAGRSSAIAISVLMPLLPARARSASADRLGETARRERLVLQSEPGGVGFHRIDNQRRQGSQMIGAALDGGGPSAFARADIGGRQQLGQRDDAGQRRADIVHDAGKRGFDRAPRRACARDGLPRGRWRGRARTLRFAIPLPRRRPCHGSRVQSSPTSLRMAAGVAPCARSSRKAGGAASISTACGRRRRGSGGDGGSGGLADRAAPAAGGGREVA